MKLREKERAIIDLLDDAKGLNSKQIESWLRSPVADTLKQMVQTGKLNRVIVVPQKKKQRGQRHLSWMYLYFTRRPTVEEIKLWEERGYHFPQSNNEEEEMVQTGMSLYDKKKEVLRLLEHHECVTADFFRRHFKVNVFNVLKELVDAESIFRVKAKQSTKAEAGFIYRYFLNNPTIQYLKQYEERGYTFLKMGLIDEETGQPWEPRSAKVRMGQRDDGTLCKEQQGEDGEWHEVGELQKEKSDELLEPQEEEPVMTIESEEEVEVRANEVSEVEIEVQPETNNDVKKVVQDGGFIVFQWDMDEQRWLDVTKNIPPLVLEDSEVLNEYLEYLLKYWLPQDKVVRFRVFKGFYDIVRERDEEATSMVKMLFLGV